LLKDLRIEVDDLRVKSVLYLSLGYLSKGKFEGAKPLQNQFLPLSFEGEGDRG